jgi:membrane protease YdiL (CAAX protease family)
MTRSQGILVPAGGGRRMGTPEAGVLVLPRWQVALLLAGFPALYLLNSVAPWSTGLFVRHERAYFLPFWTTVILLHWLSAVLAVWFVYRSGGTLADLGLRLPVGRAAVLVGLLLTLGAGVVAFRELVPYGPGDGSRADVLPWDRTERVVFVLVSLSAGICEELVYRGFGLTALRGRGWQTWQAVAVTTLAFVFVHGVAGLILFPFYALFGLLFAGLFLWRQSLVPGVMLHASYDILVILIP